MAVIKYETPDGPVEYSVASSDISYEDDTDHWRVKAGEEDGRDVYELIPRERVFSVKVVGKQTGTSVTRTK
ncbi:hypothetical protein halTADL_0835 [Halohasta litchfieldiae]|jgi:hypothetical protein|uniref:Uncharacterized protein n=1 Tax=Halohasta litchfieldiae TaxID=1073996 RepID=A0A1H6TII3_9EURY|nr:hypothetical protein [Halohasta litchfieldiae]ATW87632.1 hypothetical protein halTADL_0835 [Halohasta litchfieldiae]SEI76957.1 hypothetical protein SAMN05444271_107146 [Halohasta litchfieldiae]